MRSRQFNISPDVSEAYWALAQAFAKAADQGLSHKTPDEIADNVLRKHIQDNYPKLFEELSVRARKVEVLDTILVNNLLQNEDPDAI